MKSRLILSLSVTAVLLSFCSVRATDITYDVNLILNLGGGDAEGLISGTITTDGTLGEISASDILSWNLFGMGYDLEQANVDNANSFVGSGLGTNVAFARGRDGRFVRVRPPFAALRFAEF